MKGILASSHFCKDEHGRVIECFKLLTDRDTIEDIDNPQIWSSAIPESDGKLVCELRRLTDLKEIPNSRYEVIPMKATITGYICEDDWLVDKKGMYFHFLLATTISCKGCANIGS